MSTTSKSDFDQLFRIAHLTLIALKVLVQDVGKQNSIAFKDYSGGWMC
ncbi:hypothetical protein IQ244_23055 [Nostoc sp. LEGE 06077]|nr:hypothetical protein [Nostoc sp. LEGE 06077]